MVPISDGIRVVAFQKSVGLPFEEQRSAVGLRFLAADLYFFLEEGKAQSRLPVLRVIWLQLTVSYASVLVDERNHGVQAMRRWTISAGSEKHLVHVVKYMFEAVM